MPLPAPPPGTIAVYSDIACPWATVVVHRLCAARHRLGLDGVVHLEHRTFPLELVNRRPTPKELLDAEVPVAAALAPDFGWRMWRGPAHAYAVTSLPAMEAVQAVAAECGADDAERFDLALRRALFCQSRCISMVTVIIDVAHEAGIDTALVEAALADGRARRRVRRAPDGVTGSPHIVLPNGVDAFNPGVDIELLDGHIPRVRTHRPEAIDEIVQEAAGQDASVRDPS